MDLWFFSAKQISAFSVYFLSRILDHHHSYAGSVFLFCKETLQETVDRKRIGQGEKDIYYQ